MGDQIQTVVEVPSEASEGELIYIVVTIYNTTTIPEPHNIDWALPSILVDGKAVFTGDQRHIPPIEYDEKNYEIWYYEHVMPAKAITITVNSYFESGYYPFHLENTVNKVVQLSGGPPPPPPGYANIYGTLTDGLSGQPLAGVTITLDSKSTTSAADGSYNLTDITPGTYSVIFTLDGYNTRILYFDLEEGNNNLSIQLIPSTAPPPPGEGGGFPWGWVIAGTAFLGFIIASKRARRSRK